MTIIQEHSYHCMRRSAFLVLLCCCMVVSTGEVIKEIRLFGIEKQVQADIIRRRDASLQTLKHFSDLIDGALQRLESRWASQFNDEIAPALASSTRTIQRHASDHLLYQPWETQLTPTRDPQQQASSSSRIDILSAYLPALVSNASAHEGDLPGDRSSRFESLVPKVHAPDDRTHVMPKAAVRRLLGSLERGARSPGEPHRSKKAAHGPQASTPAPKISPGRDADSGRDKKGTIPHRHPAEVHTVLPPSPTEEKPATAPSSSEKAGVAPASTARKDAYAVKAHRVAAHKHHRSKRPDYTTLVPGKASQGARTPGEAPMDPHWGPTPVASVSGAPGPQPQQASFTQRIRINGSVPLTCSKPKEARRASAGARTAESAELALAEEIEDAVMEILKVRRTAGLAAPTGAPAPSAWSLGYQTSAAVVSDAGAVNATCVAGALAIAIAVSAFGPATASAAAGCGDTPCPPSARRSHVIHAGAPAYL